MRLTTERVWEIISAGSYFISEFESLMTMIEENKKLLQNKELSTEEQLDIYKYLVTKVAYKIQTLDRKHIRIIATEEGTYRDSRRLAIIRNRTAVQKHRRLEKEREIGMSQSEIDQELAQFVIDETIPTNEPTVSVTSWDLVFNYLKENSPATTDMVEKYLWEYSPRAGAWDEILNDLHRENKIEKTPEGEWTIKNKELMIIKSIDEDENKVENRPIQNGTLPLRTIGLKRKQPINESENNA